MLIDSIVLRDFGRYAEARVDLRGVPVAVLMGPNRAGKSTIADAVRWALRNAARGFGGSTNAALVRRGGTACKVTVTARRDRTAPAVSVSRTKSGADASQATILQTLGVRDDAALEAALDAGRFLAMSPKERKALAFRAAGCVLDEATLRAAGVDSPEVLAAALTKGPEAAERLATEKKRAEARAADAVRVTPPTDVAVTTPRGMVPVSALDPAQMEATVVTLRAERDAAQRALAAAERGLSDAAARAQRVAAARTALATAEADLVAARNAATKAAAGRPSAARLRAEAEELLPAMGETPPTAPELRPILPAPSTAEGQTARETLGEAERELAAAQHRASAAAEALTRAREALADAKAGPWQEVAGVAKRLRSIAETPDGQDVADDLEKEADALDALVTQHAPVQADVVNAVAMAEAVAKRADAAVATAQGDVERRRARLEAVSAAWRTEKAKVDAENAARAKANADLEDVYRKRCAEQAARVRTARDRRAALLADAARVEQLEEREARTLREAEGSLRAAQAHLEGVATEPAPTDADPVALRSTVARLDGEIDAAARTARAVAEFHAARERCAGANAKAAALDAAAARYERMEKALRPDGVVGRLAAGPLGALREVLARIDRDVRVTDEWDVLIRDAAPTAASRSEAWRAGAALTVALAVVSGVRFAIIDDADVLVDGAERSAFLRAVADLRTHFDQVLIVGAMSPAATAALKPAPDADVIAFWRVVDGRVEPVLAPSTAATAAA